MNKEERNPRDVSGLLREGVLNNVGTTHSRIIHNTGTLYFDPADVPGVAVCVGSVECLVWF